MSFDVMQGDALAVLRGMPERSFDGVLCDPPYGLSSAEKRNMRRQSPRASSRAKASGFMGMTWDATVPGPEIWAEVLRVLKPGAMLMAFGGTRTHHRLMCAIEDAGFEIRDTLMWIHGQGFPKSLDISKAIDKAAGAEREVVGSQNVKDIRRSVKRDREIGHTTGQPKYGPGTPADRIDHLITAPSTDAARLWDGYGTALKSRLLTNADVSARINELTAAIAPGVVEASIRKRSWRVQQLQEWADDMLALRAARKLLYAGQLAEGQIRTVKNQAEEDQAILEGFREDPDIKRAAGSGKPVKRSLPHRLILPSSVDRG
jgi:hypothetical protein